MHSKGIQHKRFLFWLVLCAFALAWGGVQNSSAHPSHGFGKGALFHSTDLGRAMEFARKEHKLVFAYARNTGQSLPTFLTRPTVAEWPVVDLLIQEAVGIELTSETHTAELKRLAVEIDELPAILLIKQDGSVRSQLSGTMTASALLEALGKLLSDDETVKRARLAIETNRSEDPLAHERLAESLRRNGDLAGALQEYLWCINKGLRLDYRYAAARRRVIFERLVDFAGIDDAAKAAVMKTRESLKASILDGSIDPNLARDYSELNCCLGEPNLTLELYDSLPDDNVARLTLFDSVWVSLVERKEYENVLKLIEPDLVFAQEMRWAIRLRGVEEPDTSACPRRGSRRFAIVRGAALVEALAGTGKTEAAQKLLIEVLRFTQSADDIEILRAHVARSDNEAVSAFLKQQVEKKQRPSNSASFAKPG